MIILILIIVPLTRSLQKFSIGSEKATIQVPTIKLLVQKVAVLIWLINRSRNCSIIMMSHSLEIITCWELRVEPKPLFSNQTTPSTTKITVLSILTFSQKLQLTSSMRMRCRSLRSSFKHVLEKSGQQSKRNRIIFRKITRVSSKILLKRWLMKSLKLWMKSNWSTKKWTPKTPTKRQKWRPNKRQLKMNLIWKRQKNCKLLKRSSKIWRKIFKKRKKSCLTRLRKT